VHPASVHVLRQTLIDVSAPAAEAAALPRLERKSDPVPVESHGSLLEASAASTDPQIPPEPLRGCDG
jgi:hypothetical protein